MKRVIIISRNVLERGKCGYFNSNKEYEILIDLTDKKINEKIQELNKNKRSRFYEKEVDFNLETIKGKKEFINYIIDNHKNMKELEKYFNKFISIFE